MELQTAEKAHELLSKIEKLKGQIKWLSDNDCVLCFGNKPSGMTNDNISASQYKNRVFAEILNKHHKLIIQELENEIKGLEKQIEEL